jgi:superfamily II DNA or RNA helicase
LGVGNKSVLKTIQRVGRGLRKKDTGENVVTVIDFIDRTSDYLYRHSVSRCSVYVKMKIKIYEVLDRTWTTTVER